MEFKVPFEEQRVLVRIEITPKFGSETSGRSTHSHEVILMGEDGVWEAKREGYPYRGTGTTAIHAIVDLLKHACEQDW